jgi:hypothetical protein
VTVGSVTPGDVDRVAGAEADNGGSGDIVAGVDDPVGTRIEFQRAEIGDGRSEPVQRGLARAGREFERAVGTAPDHAADEYACGLIDDEVRIGRGRERYRRSGTAVDDARVVDRAGHGVGTVLVYFDTVR